MEKRRIHALPCTALLALTSLGFHGAHAQQAPQRPAAARWVLEAVGTETVRPDVIHLMMKMEYESGLAADATREGERQLREFLAVVDALNIPNLSYHVQNSIITPARAGGRGVAGFVYTRNIVFTLTLSDPGQPPGALDPVIARLEDLGARHNSHCVTCIGSG